MITELSLENFKSWRRINKMRLAPITGLFGANSSGKTSIFQFLLMLKQTTESSDRTQALNLGDEKSLVSLGLFRDVVFAHEKQACLKCALSWRRHEPLKVKDPDSKTKTLFKGSTMSFETEVMENGSGQMLAKRITYGLKRLKILHQRKKHGSKMARFIPQWTKFTLQQKQDDAYKYDLQSDDFDFRRMRGRAWSLPSPSKCYGFPDEVRTYYQNAGFLSDFEFELEKLFKGVYYLGPLREYPKREYTWAGASPVDMGRRGEKVVEALLSLEQRKEKISLGRGKKSPLIQSHIASWLKELGLIHEFRVEPIAKESNLYRVKIRMTPQSSMVSITDVGFGVSQVLPVITICYYVPKGSIVILEQPEIHLHPSAQEGLADVFIDAVKRRGVQIIIESHSEHLLRRLQRRIAEEELDAAKTALYFTSMTEAGESQLLPLALDEFGAMANWPENFFGNEFDEIAATSKAIMKRKGVNV